MALVTIWRSPVTRTPATTLATCMAMQSAGISALSIEAIVIADHLNHTSPGSLTSSAASPLGGAAPGSPLVSGKVMMVSAMKVRRCQCPLTVTTPIDLCSVTILIKTDSILVDSPTTRAYTPVSSGRTCAKV